MIFKDRVLKVISRHGDITTLPKGSVINFLSNYYGTKKAFYVKAHGHITKDKLHNLENYQHNTGITVILVSEQPDHIPRFEALSRYLRWRRRMGDKV